MYRNELPSMFNSLEDYENFVSQLLKQEPNLKVDPMLDWEDVMDEQTLIIKPSMEI